MKIHTFEVDFDHSGVGRVRLAGVTLFSADMSLYLTTSAPTRREEAENELMHRFALRMKEAIGS